MIQGDAARQFGVRAILLGGAVVTVASTAALVGSLVAASLPLFVAAAVTT
ncbi:hypothetical protein [Nocardia sp. CY41]|nr:hypothetical protein [Nocardia sp. CY41]